MRLNNKQKDGLTTICDDLVKATIIGITLNQNANVPDKKFRLIYVLIWFTIAIILLWFSLQFRRKNYE